MMYLLDTNVCIQFLNRKSRPLIEKLSSIDPDEILLCAVVKAELLYGAFKSNNPLKVLKIQGEFFSGFKSLDFDDKSANVFGKIRSNLEKKGKIIGPYDLLIASIAIANNVTLVTHNTREFSRVEGLDYEDWEE
ncbi:MAG: type II toxin-antitoxin system VapC family toxin [Candidatus Aminicenantes bacterium]|nr:type II toxin-antitoxin system VapC family toxin [Candidatus Aminicenantes bacterium]